MESGGHGHIKVIHCNSTGRTEKKKKQKNFVVVTYI
jgi:hypothetical protein